MLHLYGTREDTKIWAKIISAHAKKCSRIGFRRWGEVGGAKRELWTDLSGEACSFPDATNRTDLDEVGPAQLGAPLQLHPMGV